ncbi:hypothetical protein L7F22_001502 [Adiantum nelumboides]|nr:hypothetical protein [Adiantum nelumboides]
MDDDPIKQGDPRASQSPSLSRVHGTNDNPLHDEHHSDTLDDARIADYDLESLDDEHIDSAEFDLLVTRMADLEKQVAALNENMSKTTDLLAQLVRNQATSGGGLHLAWASTHNVTPFLEETPITNGMGGVGMSSGGILPASDRGHGQPPVEITPHLMAPSKTLKAMAKHIKPPVFKGDDKERNKDAVNTFLHKWSDLHALRSTPDSTCAIETSLNLEGKAYKWYMSLRNSARPTTWDHFQEIFQKEFLLENEKDRNWVDWDSCQMGNLTLTQYISKVSWSDP